MDQTMEGKVAVVTGASRGIGKAIAVKLASKGATVVINYNGSRERAEEVKNEVESAGGKAVIIQCNVADFDACKEFIETVIKEQAILLMVPEDLRSGRFSIRPMYCNNTCSLTPQRTGSFQL